MRFWLVPSENCHWLGFTLWITTKEFDLLVSNTSHVELKFAVWVALRTSCKDLRDHLRPLFVWLSIILREHLQAIAIFEEAIVTDAYNPLWLDWIDVVLREVAEGVWESCKQQRLQESVHGVEFDTEIISNFERDGNFQDLAR